MGGTTYSIETAPDGTRWLCWWLGGEVELAREWPAYASDEPEPDAVAEFLDGGRPRTMVEDAARVREWLTGEVRR